MNERQEQTADVLGRLTVLGTIVLPMNIITGLWGMNVLVPGQDVDSLTWYVSISPPFPVYLFCVAFVRICLTAANFCTENRFWCITAGLLVFGGLCYLIAKRVYKIM